MNSKIWICFIAICFITSLIFKFSQRKENKHLKAEVSELNSQVSTLEDEKSDLENRAAELEEAKENLQANIDDARDNIDELKNQVEDNYWDKWETENKVRNLEDKVDEMESNNNN